jgi:hypothetical protein
MTTIKKMEFKVTSREQTVKLLEILETLGYKTYSGVKSLADYCESYPWYIHTWNENWCSMSTITQSQGTMDERFTKMDTEEFILMSTFSVDYTDIIDAQFKVTSFEQSERLLAVLRKLGHTFYDGGNEYKLENKSGNLWIQTWDDYHLTRCNYFSDSSRYHNLDTEEFIKYHTKPSTEFDYDAAKNGAKIITKYGLPVNILKWDINNEFCIVGTVVQDHVENVDKWDIKGNAWSNTANNLVMVIDRIFPKTTLSREELRSVYTSTGEGINDSLVAVANAAIQQYIIDSEK